MTDEVSVAQERRLLAERILSVIEGGPEGDPGIFDVLAPLVFAFQFENNAPYRAFCEAAGVTPASIASWRDIPAYPTDAFKREIVASFPMAEAVQAQLTSGTTSPNQRGRIFRDGIGRELVFAANRVMTGAYCFPDLGEGRRCRILILAPSPEVAPSMGMAIGMEQTRAAFGTPDSRFLVGRTGVDVKALVEALRASESTGEPVALIGATSAFVYFLASCRKKKVAFRLPAGSRVVDGGGYRGRFGVVTRDDYVGMVGETLGVPASHCVNVLGMAESATNYFDDSLRAHARADAGPGARPGAGPRHKPIPPWCRVVAVDPDTGDTLPHGSPGLLRHYDLANLPTVIGVQSDNLGVTETRGGFEIIGRAKVVDGRVSSLPSDVTVGPMGDNRVFRLLEAYVNFSIDFKSGRIASGDDKTDYVESRREADEAAGIDEGAPVASCPVVVDDLVAGTDDAESRARAGRALDVYREEPDDEG